MEFLVPGNVDEVLRIDQTEKMGKKGSPEAREEGRQNYFFRSVGKSWRFPLAIRKRDSLSRL
jgi:hypothetical protein